MVVQKYELHFTVESSNNLCDQYIRYEKLATDRFVTCVTKYANPEEPINYFCFQKINEVKSKHGKNITLAYIIKIFCSFSLASLGSSPQSPRESCFGLRWRKSITLSFEVTGPVSILLVPLRLLTVTYRGRL